MHKEKIIMNDWISVKDRLPNNDEIVLAHCHQIQTPAVLRFQHDKNDYLWMWPNLIGQVLNVTHWMPLPEPPKDE